jgi:DNA-binding transcriptional LysR family regulator
VTLRIAFAPGVSPDKWAARWRGREREPLELLPVTEDEQQQVLTDGRAEMCLARLPVDREGLHVVRLYDEVQVAVAATAHLVAAADELVLADLADEQLVRPHPSGWRPDAVQLDWPPMSEKEAIEVVAGGTGIVLVPMSVARLHHRKDVVQRPVTDLAPTTVALVWPVEHDDERLQRFVGVVRGRTPNTSR